MLKWTIFIYEYLKNRCKLRSQLFNVQTDSIILRKNSYIYGNILVLKRACSAAHTNTAAAQKWEAHVTPAELYYVRTQAGLFFPRSSNVNKQATLLREKNQRSSAQLMGNETARVDCYHHALYKHVVQSSWRRKQQSRRMTSALTGFSGTELIRWRTPEGTGTIATVLLPSV